MRPIDADALKNMRFSCGMHDDNYIVYAPIREVMENIDKAPTVGGWISVKDRLPEEKPSIFDRFYGTDKWSNAMWRNESEKVIVTIQYFNGQRIVTTVNTHDGQWYIPIGLRNNCIVTHWMPLPEPPEEKNDA